MYPTADDFKQIHGIGPAIEKRLHDSGILTFSQLSVMSPDELAILFADLTGLSAERIVEKNWIGQARQMAAEKVSVKPAEEPILLDSQRHYAVFTIELLLDDQNNVRRTRAVNVQNQVEELWAGWEETRLMNFFVENAGLKSPRLHEAESIDIPPVEMVEVAQGGLESVSPGMHISGELHLGEMVLKATTTEQPVKPIYSDNPFFAKLMLDLTDVQASRDFPLDYSATVYAKRWGSPSRQLVGQTEGRLVPGDRFSLEVECIQLPRGVYRMDAFVKLSSPGEMVKPGSGLMAMTEGGILQIY